MKNRQVGSFARQVCGSPSDPLFSGTWYLVICETLCLEVSVPNCQRVSIERTLRGSCGFLSGPDSKFRKPQLFQEVFLLLILLAGSLPSNGRSPGKFRLSGRCVRFSLLASLLCESSFKLIRTFSHLFSGADQPPRP